jgi:hypothetical protein
LPSDLDSIAARVVSVSKNVASAAEIVSALASRLEEPVIRVELELLPSEPLTRMQDLLHSGEQLTARVKLRDRRIIELLFDALRDWYER